MPGSLGQLREEIVGFAEFAAGIEPQHVCEIGTLHAGTSLFFSGLAPTIATFTGIDVRLRNARLVSALAPSRVEVHFIEASTREPSTLEQVLLATHGNQLDLLFVDGDHSYEGVRADFEAFRPLVRPGGLIAFHDISEEAEGEGDPPRQSADDIPVPERNWAGGVPRLWSELKPRFRHWEFVNDRTQSGFGIGVIANDVTARL